MLYRRFRFIVALLIVGASAAALAMYATAPYRQDLPSFAPPGALITGGLPDSNKTTRGTSATKLAQQSAPAPPSTATNAPNPINTSAPPPVLPIDDVITRLKNLVDQISKMETAIAGQPRNDSFLARTRPRIDTVISETGGILAELAPRLTDIDSQIAKLGPAPKKEEAPETGQIKELRDSLGGAKSEIAGAIKTAEILQERATQLASKTSELRQRLFADQVLARGRSPLSPSLLSEVARELPAGGRQFAEMFRGWRQLLAANWQTVLALVVAACAVFQLLRYAMAYMRMRGLARGDEDSAENFFQRASAAVWVAATLLLPGLAATCGLFIGLDAFGLLPVELQRLSEVILIAVFVVLIVWALATAILQPKRPAWRLFDIPSASAQRLVTIFTLLAAVPSLDLILQHLMETLFLPLPVRVVEAAMITLAFAALLFMIVRTPLVAETETPETDRSVSSTDENEGSALPIFPGASNAMAPRWLKWPALLVAIVITGAALVGYVALGRFVAGQVIVIGSLIVLGLLLMFAIRAFTRQTGDVSDRPMETALRKHLRMEHSLARLLTRSTSLFLQAALPFAAVPVLFVSWGYSITDALGWLKSLFFGFQIGQFRISLVQLLLAAGLFVAILFLTRLFQRWITARVMQPGRMDHGVAHSVHTGIGYLGFVVAALTAVAYTGFDITNLAIVAGALSIGIGFGLQSIVNNFVSGLIILFERPIKVGDWVSVNNFEGHVRRISVRSTEIETFDRTNVIVPNSEFISNPIVNLTHRNALGRIVIPVGVSYQSDPEFVRELLLKAAQECPEVLSTPAPNVTLTDFGASSLDFEIRAYIADVNSRLGVASDVRLRVFRALADAGIEIPFPQTDVHMRDLDPVRSMLQRIALEKAGQAARGGNDKSS